MYLFIMRTKVTMLLIMLALDIYEGEWLAIVGHNGSGKSTMAKLLNGLQFPQQGEITVCGNRFE